MKRTALHSAIVAALAGYTAAGTQVAWSQEGALEEIIVTAEFRQANVQDTPIAITAVNAEMLEARSQTNLAQITAQTPNVSLRPAGSSSGSALIAYIRGIGQSDFNPSVEPGVGIYVDDVYYSTITGNILDLLDLDRVEVLRGPQGTLAGRNAIGGAIKLFTRKPDGSDDATVQLTKGEFNRTEIKGAAGMTLVEDKLYMRIAGIAKSMDGYVTRLDYACTHHLPPPGQPGGLPTYSQTAGCKLGEEGGQSYASGRLGLRWEASDNFTVDIAASIVNDKSESQPGVLVAAFPHHASSIPITFQGFGPPQPNPAFDGTGTTLVPIYFDNDNSGTFTAGDVEYDNKFVTGGTYTNYATYINDGQSTPSPLFQGGTPGANNSVFKPYVIDPVNTLSSWDASLNLNWQISDSVSLLSVSAYRTYDNSFAEDTDGSPLAVQQLLQRLEHKQTTQELRLSVNLDAVDLTFGYFYLDQKTNEDARVDLPYVGFDFIHGPDLVPAKNDALYAQAAFHLGDKTNLSFGLRYSEDEKNYTFARHNPDGSDVLPCTGSPLFWEGVNPPNCGVGPTGNPLVPLNGLKVSYSSDNTDWRIALSRDLSDSTMLYLQASTGYKAGGNNARPFFPSQSHAFLPETLDSYEVGLKTTMGGNTRLNAAVFSNTYDNIQLPTNVCYWAPATEQTPCASQDNVGDADVWGFELEAEWHPTEQFSFDAAYGYLNFEYSRVNPISPVTLSMVSPYTPESKASVGLQYDFSVGMGGTLTPRIDVAYTDDVFSNAVNAPTNHIDGYSLVNARLTWRSMTNNWQVALEGTNLTDEYYYVTLFDLSNAAAGYIHGQPSRPREFAMSVRRNF